MKTKKRHYFTVFKIVTGIKVFLCLGLLIIFIGSCKGLFEKTEASAGFEFSKSRLKKFEAEIELLQSKLNIPGISAIIVKDGKTVWAKGFGYSDLDKNIAATPNTVYHLASVSKAFASAVILQLVESEKLSLDDPINKYQIDLGDSGQVKVKHLLSHTSDLPPGSFFRYNGNRYAMLDAVIYESTGKPFSEHIKEKIFQPLQLNNTAPGTDTLNYPVVHKNLTVPYNYDSTNNVIHGSHNPYFGCAAGLMSSCTDLAFFDQALDSNLLISEGMKKKAFSPFISNDGQEFPYGLGWFSQKIAGLKVVWAFGYGYCTSSLYLKIPELNTTFIILANTWNLSHPFPIGIVDVPVTESPFALEFFKTFLVGKDSYVACKTPDVNWFGNPDEIIDQIRKVKDKDVIKALQNELVINWNIANVMNNKTEKENLYKIFKESLCNPQYFYKEKKLIGELRDIKPDQKKSMTFNLNEEKKIRVYANADGAPWSMYYKIKIQNLDNDSLVWYMDGFKTTRAGGHPRNRHVDTVLSLMPGNYEISIDNTDSPYNHAYDNWEAFPPFNLFWGIAIFEE